MPTEAQLTVVPQPKQETRSEYYAAMAKSHDAEAIACDFQARAAELVWLDDETRRAASVATERARAETYRRLAESYRRMAAGEFGAASEAINDAATVRP